MKIVFLCPMAKWEGRSRGGRGGYSIFIWSLRRLGFGFSYFLLRFVALHFFLWADKEGIRYYFRQRMDFSKAKTRCSIYRNFFLFGQVLLDKIGLLSGLPHKFTFDFEGEEFLHRMAEEKAGGMLIGSHIGNWEIAGQLLERIDVPVHIVMYDGENPAIKDLLDDAMVKKKIDIIFIKDDFSHLERIAKALQNGELIAMHGDRYLPGVQADSINFLGEEALFPTGPFFLAAKYQVPVTFVSAMKESKTHYHFYATEPVKYPAPKSIKERKTIVRSMMEKYIKEMERVIRKYPLQWFNYYQFWKKETE